MCVKPLWAYHRVCLLSPSSDLQENFLEYPVLNRIFGATSSGRSVRFDLLKVGPAVTSQVGVGAAAIELIAGSPSEIRRFFRFRTVVASYPVEGLDPLGAFH